LEPKAQQEPHWPWFLIALTAPRVRQSMPPVLAAGVSLLLPEGSTGATGPLGVSLFFLFLFFLFLFFLFLFFLFLFFLFLFFFL